LALCAPSSRYQLISIEFTTPIWTALLANVPAREAHASAPHGVALGLVGMLIIVRPGATPIQAGHLAVLGAAVMFGISLVMVKSLPALSFAAT
jgi:drug/metabolite transporter (DMT)-like permease